MLERVDFSFAARQVATARSEFRQPVKKERGMRKFDWSCIVHDEIKRSEFSAKILKKDTWWDKKEVRSIQMNKYELRGERGRDEKNESENTESSLE